MLPFQKEALLDVSSVDCNGMLLVMGRGLGLPAILRNLLTALANPHGLVLVLGLHDSDVDYLLRDGSFRLPQLDANTAPSKRQECYGGRGLMACTARVLLVDLLQGRLNPTDITGIVIHRADEHLEEHGVVAFILAICKRAGGDSKRGLFVKALTERPEQLVSGFAGLERAMRTLNLNSAAFYPRFQRTVRTDLDGAAVDVVEVKVRLGREGRAAQVFLVDLMTRSVKHLVSHNAGLLDGDLFPVDFALSAGFEQRLLHHLDLNYRTVDSVTSTCLQEIYTWRHLLFLNVNCVYRADFNTAVTSLFAEACKEPSAVPTWVTLDSAELLLRHCKAAAGAPHVVNPKMSAVLELRHEEKDLLVVTGNEPLYDALLGELDGDGGGEATGKRVRRGGRLRAALMGSDTTWLDHFTATTSTALCLTDLTLDVIRQVEVAVAASSVVSTCGDQRRVYYLMFTESAEEQRYLAALRREKDAFESLIRTYSDLPEVKSVASRGSVDDVRFSSLLRDRDRDRDEDGDRDGDRDGDNVITVDVRELRSALPFVLFKRNYTILPITLLTGDYLPSAGVCVERKTIPDLTSSLNNGRLLSQTERMSADFDLSCLLVELDTFRRSPWSDDNLYVVGKMAVLLHHRPLLRVLWAGGPAAAADLLHDLRRTSTVSTVSTRSDTTARYSAAGRNALLGFRGIIDEGNVGGMLDNFKSLRDVFTADRERLRGVLGRDLGDKLFDCLHA